MVSGIGMDPGLAASQKEITLLGLKKACSEFESLFLTHMLKSMGESMVEEGYLGKSHESQIIQSMFHENLALGIAKGGGIGIGEILFDRLKERI